MRFRPSVRALVSVVCLLLPFVNGLDSLRNLTDSIFIGAAANLGDLKNDAQHEDKIASQYNLITAENECKWGATEPQQNNFDFSDCDELATFAGENGMTFRGHNLCWGMYNPAWLDSLSPADKKAALVNHIHATVSHYDGVITIWDVVNEAVNDTATGTTLQPLKKSTWYPDIPDYITVAFETARDTCDDCILFYNDYSIASMYGWSAHKSDAVYELVKGMVEGGVPIDGVGIQCHIDLAFGDEMVNGTRSNIQRLGELGLQVQITELDIACGSSPDYLCPEWTDELEAQQGQLYADLLQVCLESPYCTNFETWGFTDKYTWLTSVDGQEEYPLPFDATYEPKEAFDSMVQVLKAQQRRDEAK